ncbi:hypothetical protein DPMN_068384 [Dreissena polymorpha]|uniref:Uncharacterized protein n=1 Tax=Dreissena polymorpha TaxID=45954 RepID=A0A9D3Z128_DREPO|nr:hypothetical protein DPMN_068384 [Dreissena polymorpha]
MVNGQQGDSQQGVVARYGHDKTQKTSWMSTTSVSVSSRLDPVLPLDQDGLRRENSSKSCENLPHLNLSHHTSHSVKLAPSIKTTSDVATGERRTDRCGYIGSRRRNPAHRLSRALGPS